jgi:hypothetical protein
LRLYNSAGDAGIRQDLSSGAVDQVKGRYLAFSFWMRCDDDEAGIARLQEYSQGLWWTYDSPWIYDSQESGSPWIDVRVSALIGSLASQVRVALYVDDLNEDYAGCWVDDAQLLITDLFGVSSSFGTVYLAVNIERVLDRTETLRRAWIKLAMAADSTSYYVKAMKIRIAMGPNDGSSTTQVGNLNIFSLAETNDKDCPAKPAGAEQDVGLAITAVAVDAVVTGLIAALVASPGGGLILGLVASTGTRFLMDYLGDSAEGDDTQATGGSNFFTQVIWDYTDGTLVCNRFGGGFMKRAAGLHELDWTWAKSGSGYFIRISATADWGQIECQNFVCYVAYRGSTTADISIWA